METYRRLPPARSAIAIEQLSFLHASVAHGVWPMFLYASVVLPILPFAFANGGYPLTREYATLVLLSLCWFLPGVPWQHRLGKKGGDAYFLSLPAEGRWHLALRAGAGWPPLVTLGLVLLTAAFLGPGSDDVPVHGWLAPLIGMTVFYLVLAGLALRARHAIFLILVLIWLPFEMMKLGPAVGEKVERVLESALILFMGSDVRVGRGAEDVLIGSVGFDRWLMTSAVALTLGITIFLLLVATFEREKWA